MKQPYTDKIITITGGSSGIGAELARQLCAQGAVVIIAARSRGPAEALVAELTKAGGHASYLPLDVQDATDCRRFFADVLQKHGRLDYAINAAGIIMGGEIRDNDIDDIQKVLMTNVLGTTYCATEAYKLMVTQGYGHIVNFSSGAGLFPAPLLGVYSASKFAVYGLSEAMRIEGRALGVRTSVVTPGLVDTPIYDTAVYSNADKGQSKGLLQHKLYMIQPDQAARRILRGVARNQAVVGTQFYVRLTWLSYRLFPWAYRWSIGLLLPVFRKKYRQV